jgi:hypothetical protein|tara:strand:+ start:387 stop:662 length:276 start_codon:yes stop_codon:yes gene_type:complete
VASAAPMMPASLKQRAGISRARARSSGKKHACSRLTQVHLLPEMFRWPRMVVAFAQLNGVTINMHGISIRLDPDEDDFILSGISAFYWMNL